MARKQDSFGSLSSLDLPNGKPESPGNKEDNMTKCLQAIARVAMDWYRSNSEAVVDDILLNDIGYDDLAAIDPYVLQNLKTLIANPMPSIIRRAILRCLEEDGPLSPGPQRPKAIQRLTSQIMSLGDKKLVENDSLLDSVRAGVHGLLEEVRHSTVKTPIENIQDRLAAIEQVWAKAGGPLPPNREFPEIVLKVVYSPSGGLYVTNMYNPNEQVHINFASRVWSGTLTEEMALPLDLLRYARDQLQDLVFT